LTDVFSKTERSEIMRRVKAHGNKSTEMRLVALFRKNGITGWRRNYPVKGRPDFVFPEKKVAVFVDGCFWHGHDCRNTRPEAHKEYWQKKRERNIQRDKEIIALFEARGWVVLRIWECELKMKNETALVEKFLAVL
jgi:DNA mismatch endonuclease (patch repair protein)